MGKAKSKSRTLRRRLLITMIACLLTVLGICTALFHITYRRTDEAVSKHFAALPEQTVSIVSDAYYQQFMSAMDSFLNYFCMEWGNVTERYCMTPEDYAEAEEDLFWNHLFNEAAGFFYPTYCNDSIFFCLEGDDFLSANLDTGLDTSEEFNAVLRQMDAGLQAHPEFYQNQTSYADYIRVTAQDRGAGYSKDGDGCIVVWMNLNRHTEFDTCVGIVMNHVNSWVQPIDRVALEQSGDLTRSMEEMFRRNVYIMVVSAAGVLLLFIIVSAILSKKLADPVVSEHEMLMQVNQMKTAFLSDVSHELKTPLAAMSGYAQNAESELMQGGSQTLIRDKLRRISAEANRMALMVTQILDATRIEEGRMVLEQAPCDLEALVRETAEIYFAVLNKNNNRLAIRMPLELPKVNADSARLQRVFVNLISNAMKHTHDGVIVIKAEAEENQVIVTVKDTGSGISAEDLPHIWERYYKGRHSETGTGLGLFITRFIIESHGGSIRAESEEGKGTSFIFSLPAAM